MPIKSADKLLNFFVPNLTKSYKECRKKSKIMCGDCLKNKDKTIFNYILKEVGIEISPVLEHLIMNPTKIETLNSIALEQVVDEFAPIYQKYRSVLDGPKELSKIGIFMMFLSFRLNNQPKLQRILDGDL